MTPRPPLGIMPEWLHKEQRFADICTAIQRYENANYLIPIEWVEEQHEIFKWLTIKKPTSILLQTFKT